MNDEPQKRTIQCPRCEKPIDAIKRRLFDNLYNCGECDLYIQDGPGWHGVADMHEIHLPKGMCIFPHAIGAETPILKFMYYLLQEVSIGWIEKVMDTISSGPGKILLNNDPRAAYALNLLARLGIKVL